MFTLQKFDIHGQQFVRLKCESGELQLNILPKFGGNIAGLKLASDGRTVDLVSGYRTLDEARANQGYQGAKLFPFPNRIRDGQYRFDGVDYQLPINRPKENNAIHGFFTDKPFQILKEIEAETHALLIVGCEYTGNYPGYPFPCRVEIEYVLSIDDHFTCRTIVTNSGEGPMPVADGWHPYFSMGGPIDRLRLKLPASRTILADERMIPTGTRIDTVTFDEATEIGCSLLDTGFALDVTGEPMTTRLVDPKSNLVLSLSQQTGENKYNYLQVYTPPGREKIAIEPMTCPADGFNSGEGLITLEPGESFSTAFGVRLDSTSE